MPEVHTIVTGEWRENCYVLRGEGRHAVVIDPGEDTDVIVGYLEKEALTVDAIINTHAHYDHVGSVADIRSRYNAPFHLHAGDHRLLKQVNFYRVIFGGKRTIAIPDVDVDLATCQTLMFGRVCCFPGIHYSARASAVPICPAATRRRWGRAFSACYNCRRRRWCFPGMALVQAWPKS
jgi:glyoxylase-like metal-dependent hydrolase (beta-lactamase superfamily II)